MHPAGEEFMIERTPIDIGLDHWIGYYTAYAITPAHAGFFMRHRNSRGDWCLGSIMFNLPGLEAFDEPKWTLLSPDPLHVEPSLHCAAPMYDDNGKPLLNDDGSAIICRDHGWVRDGRWVPA